MLRLSPFMLILGLLALPAAARGETRAWEAKTLYEQSTAEHVQISGDGQRIELISGELIEDDGPAAGYSYRPNIESLGGEVAIQKQLLIADPAARSAKLLIAPGGDLRVSINGRGVRLSEPRKVGGYWQAYEFDPAVLQAGVNDLVIRGTGQVWIARDEDFHRGSLTRTSHPNRSAKSRDGGRTWDDAHLGAGDDLDGEYYVRLFLDRVLPEGRITSPVIDLGNLGDTPIPPPVEEIDGVEVVLQVERRPSDTVELRYRRSSTWLPDEETWAPWKSLAGDSGDASLRFALPDETGLQGRYLQIELRLASGDRLQSPSIGRLVISANSQVQSSWTDNLRVVNSKNPPLVRSSIPFVYEQFDHPRLKKLREEHNLDEVVGDARSELELISRLAAWSASRWKKLGHLGEAYPPWDALAILTAHADGTPVGGFCLQYNLVFLQACESFGIPGRIVSIGAGDRPSKIRSGHETVELWSNQFEKWIHVDGNTAWYFTDVMTGVPLSLLELRERQLAAWEGEASQSPPRLVRLAQTQHEWKGLDEWPAFAELRIVPRSNFLEQQFPLPLNQGMRGWFWTGHYVWSDEEQPASVICSHRVLKREDWAPVLNRAHIHLEPTSTPGELRVHLDRHTLGLDTYLAALNGDPLHPVEPTFSWRLRSGMNRLEVRPRNIAGGEGIESWIEIDYRPRD